MVGVRQKAPVALVGRQRARLARRVEAAPRPAGWRPPAPPRGLSPMARRAWRAFWASDVSRAVDERADLPLLCEWARAIDELEAVRAAMRQEATRELAARERALLRLIIEVSDRFGMSPLARFRLQLTGAEAQRSVRALSREIEADAEVIDLREVSGEPT